LQVTIGSGDHSHVSAKKLSATDTLEFRPDGSAGYAASRWFNVHLSLGINPGTPVATTALNLCRVLIPSLISFIASSGSVEILKFSLMRLGVLDVVRRAVPRCTAHASSTWAGVLLTLLAMEVITGSSVNLGSVL
jgi:hypothetical protein